MDDTIRLSRKEYNTIIKKLDELKKYNTSSCNDCINKYNCSDYQIRGKICLNFEEEH